MTGPNPQGQSVKRTVLIADDEEALAGVIATTLDLEEGLQIVVTHDGEQALVLARALHPDLILLDVMMPGRSGIEVCVTRTAFRASCRYPAAGTGGIGGRLGLCTLRCRGTWRLDKRGESWPRPREYLFPGFAPDCGMA